MKSTKKVIKFVSITEYKRLESYLEKMAAKGLMLDKIKRNIFIFKKTEPVDVTFSVSLFYNTTPFDYPDNEPERDFRQLCQECGWNFCASNNLYQIFYKDNDVEAVPIHTDSYEEFRIIKDTFIKTDFIMMPFIFIFIIMGIINIQNFNYKDLLSNGALFSIIWPIYIAIIWVVIFITPMVWFIKNKINLRKGKELTFFTDSQIRIKNAIFWILTSIYVFLYILGLMDIALKAFPALSIGIPILLPTIVTLLCIKRFKTKKRPRKHNIIFFSIASILTMTVSIQGVIILMSSGILSNSNKLNQDNNNPIPKSIRVLKLSDFETMDRPARTRFKRRSSIFSPVNIEYYESLGRKRGNNEVGAVKTTYIECLNGTVVKYILNKYLENEREKIDEYHEKEERQENYIIPITNNIWDIDEGYYLLDNKSKVIIKKGIHIYILESDVDFSDQDIIKVCTEKLQI